MTPPDVLTQFLMAAPLILLYGFSILIVRWVNPAAKEEMGDINDGDQTGDHAADQSVDQIGTADSNTEQKS